MTRAEVDEQLLRAEEPSTVSNVDAKEEPYSLDAIAPESRLHLELQAKISSKFFAI